MDQIFKQARLLKAETTEADLALINAQSLRPLEAQEIFAFRLAACDDQVDRDNERFTLQTLRALLGSSPDGRSCRTTSGVPEVRPPGSMQPMWRQTETSTGWYCAATCPGCRATPTPSPPSSRAFCGSAAWEFRYAGSSAPSAVRINARSGVSTAVEKSTMARSVALNWMVPRTPMRCLLWLFLPNGRPEPSKASATADRMARRVTRRGTPVTITRTGRTRPFWNWKKTDFKEELK